MISIKSSSTRQLSGRRIGSSGQITTDASRDRITAIVHNALHQRILCSIVACLPLCLGKSVGFQRSRFCRSRSKVARLVYLTVPPTAAVSWLCYTMLVQSVQRFLLCSHLHRWLSQKVGQSSQYVKFYRPKNPILAVTPCNTVVRETLLVYPKPRPEFSEA